MEKSNKLDWLALGLFFGSALGVTGGILTTRCYQKQKKIHPELILENVKTYFLSEGPIEGAWIEFTKQPLQKFAIQYETYTGGITRKEDDEMTQYEFIADAHTGTILDLYRI